MTILIVDDDQDILRALRILLDGEGVECELCVSPEEAIEWVKRRRFELAILDMNYRVDTTSGNEGLLLIEALRNIDELLPLIVMTGWGSITLAVQAMKCGAMDFVEKPWKDNDQLFATLRRGMELGRLKRSESALKAENRALRLGDHGQVRFIAESESMQACLELVHRVAESDIPLLITGENGTGKSFLAKYIHECSNRSAASFVTVNMGGVMDAALESELFGHVKGAYTGADAQRIGKVEMAGSGTLFLDEIANMPLNQQAKLLYLLEERRFTKLGGSQEQSAEFRVISATNVDLTQKIEQGEFRQDLRYRLEGMPIEIPPLRERQKDIEPIARSIKDMIPSGRNLNFHVDAIELMHAYAWPGNVRELRHVVERACLLAKEHWITRDDLHINNDGQRESTIHRNFGRDESSLMDVERLHIERVVANTTGIEEAASVLGLSRSALYRKLEKHELK